MNAKSFSRITSIIAIMIAITSIIISSIIAIIIGNEADAPMIPEGKRD